MQDHDPPFRLQLGKRLLQANSVADRFLNELLNERLAPCV